MNGVRPSMVLLAIAAAMGIGLAGGWWWAERGDPSWPSYASLFERSARSVVSVSVDGGAHRLGSGFAVAPDEVVTSLHIVDEAGTIWVRDIDGARWEATVLGSDARSDLALLSVTGAELVPVELGATGTLRVGDAVVAIGNPFGLGHSLSAGVVGHRGRRLAREADEGPRVDFVQLSIPLNPGNSGGPVFDQRGRVVGVLSGVHAQGQAIAFAVPVEVVLEALPALRAGEVLSRAYLGARFEEAEGGGIDVVSVTPHSPADRAGFRVGDQVVSLDGTQVTTVAAIERQLDALAGGDICEVQLVRDGALEVVDVGLADWAEQPVVAAGMTLRAAPGMGGEVLAVRPRSRAEAAGVVVGDQVRAVDGVPVRAPADVKDALTQGSGGQVELLRDGVALVVSLQAVDGRAPR